MHRRSRQPEARRFRAKGPVCKMSRDSGKLALKARSLNDLEQLGRFIHDGGVPFVFEGGLVRSIQVENEVKNGEQERRSAARSRQGQRAGPRARTTGNRHVRSDSEVGYGAELQDVVQNYRTVITEDEFGQWLAIRAHPLGPDGPIAHFIVAVPSDNSLVPKGWAFTSVGTVARPFPLKHTNFPDASICAFKPGQWARPMGLLALVDQFSVWALKSWHRSAFGWWPGPQVGGAALYRRNEFVGRELCGCESGKSYSDCHKFADFALPRDQAEQDFIRRFQCTYSSRAIPLAVMRSAQTVWRELPRMGSLFSA